MPNFLTLEICSYALLQEPKFLGIHETITYFVGPLTWKDPSTGRFKLIGVVSFGKQKCTSGDVPSAFAKVTHVLDWIKDVTGL